MFDDYVQIGGTRPSNYKFYVNGTSYLNGNIYLPKNGNIYAIGTNATSSLIRVVDNTADTSGNGISIGGGGVTIIGAGESSQNLSVAGGTEALYLLSDGAINIEANADTIANRTGIQVTAAGAVIPVKAESGQVNAQSIGTSSNYFNSMYTRWLHVNMGGSGNDGGITLYNASPSYAIYFRQTSSAGTHSYVTSDWATYFTTSDTNNRGWIFKRGSTNVASISGLGYISGNRLMINRAGGNTDGRIYWYSPTYHTWIDYMSDPQDGSCPTGGKPSTTTEVTSWAQRSLIQNTAGYGWIWEATEEGAASAATIKPTARMSLSSNTGRLRIEGNASSSTNVTGQLIVSSELNGGSNGTAIELWRGANASWQLANEGGTFYIRCNYNSAKQTTYSLNGLIMDHTTGAASLPYLALGQTNRNTSYKLYVNGTSYFNGILRAKGPVEIGSDANGRGNNYIAFYGTTGDNPGSFNHTYIGENLWGSSESSELVLFKGNDLGSNDNAITATGAGADRIRHIAAGHVFQIYRSSLSGSFDAICTSTVPSTVVEMNGSGLMISGLNSTSFTPNGASAAVTVNRSILTIYGTTYGNTAGQLKSNTAGVMSYGDGGPQIDFSASRTDGQRGAIIFTDHDSAGSGASWHFVSTESDWSVNSKRFVAKSSVTIGQNLQNSSYNLYVNGTSYFNGNVYFPNSSTIYQNQNDTSNYTTIVNWLKGSTSQKDANGNAYSYQPQIGQHNTGGTNSLGSICILPYATSSDPWGGTVGLFITKNRLMLDNCRVPTTGNTSGTIGSASQPVYINSGVVTAITGTLANSISGNAATATKLQTARTLTIGNTGKSFDGTVNVSWSRDEIGCSYGHYTSWDFTKAYSSQYVTFDASSPSGGPGGWINAFVSTHSNYLSSFIVNVHRSGDWYVGWSEHSGSNVNPTWYKLLHTGNYTSTLDGRYVKKSGDTMTGDLIIQHGTSSSVAYGATNPTITFKNSDGSQNCSLIYTDYDSVRAPAGIALIGNQGNEWFQAPRVYGAVWNDYAEYRSTSTVNPGQCVVETGLGDLVQSTKRLQPGANIVSDTFGFAIGETKQTKTPLAVSGRVLAYPYEDRYSYSAGDPVCSGPNGTISKMTRKEVREYPDRIVGTVSEIPEYETWGTGNVKVNGRIWIKVK